jgi:hypothetical protein
LAPGGLSELDAYLERLRAGMEQNYRRLDRLLASRGGIDEQADDTARREEPACTDCSS